MERGQSITQEPREVIECGTVNDSELVVDVIILLVNYLITRDLTEKGLAALLPSVPLFILLHASVSSSHIPIEARVS